MFRDRVAPILGAAVTILSILACRYPSISRSTPTPTQIPLYQQVMLTSVDHEETGSGPNYTLTTHTPVLTGSDDPRVESFNKQMAELVKMEVDLFRQNLAMQPVEPISGGSFLEIGYELVSPWQNILSLKFTVNFYSDGAAHPGSYFHSLTFDLQGGSVVALAQLFVPGSDYLTTISELCVTEISSRDIAFDASQTSGAEPSVQNYKNWNLTAEGLQISFDPYQVAAYAAGPQIVTIPYEQLISIIDPSGPLADFLP